MEPAPSRASPAKQQTPSKPAPSSCGPAIVDFPPVTTPQSKCHLEVSSQDSRFHHRVSPLLAQPHPRNFRDTPRFQLRSLAVTLRCLRLKSCKPHHRASLPDHRAGTLQASQSFITEDVEAVAAADNGRAFRPYERKRTTRPKGQYIPPEELEMGRERGVLELRR